MRQYLVYIVVALPWCPTALHGDEAAVRHFDKRVAPVFIQRCLECHSGADPRGKLDLTTEKAATIGGDSGPVLSAGKPDASLLWKRVRSNEMPPDDPLTAAEKKTLRHWIAAGAVWGSDPLDPLRFTTVKRAGYDWWALQPLEPPPMPSVEDDSWVHNGIDRFVLSRLESQELQPAPEADRRTSIRRLSFDLLGLPPSPAEVAAFESDPSPDAYERLVDRLLASPHYGIRWGRHWLDVARFGESQGFERDKLRENAWPYRDWVIGALNDDMPYDEFVRRQIAGDILYPDDGSAIVATGFLVAGPWDEVGQKQQSAAMRAVVRQDELEDLVSLVSQTFLGLTANCARCHDHKFDPIRQREYYQLTAALDGVRHGERQVRLGADRGMPKAQAVYAVTPRRPGAGHVLLRGNPARRGEPVAAGGIAALAGLEADFQLPPDAPNAQRRRHLAAWITAPANPLCARVIANRLWHYHFGRGLVATPNDFGFNGARPTHPGLIDYLAGELMHHGWSLKALHRLIVTSAAYRQAALPNEKAAASDAENRLLWQKRPRRLSAETLRDALLAVAGELNEQMGGPGYRDFETFTRNAQFYVMKDPIGPEYQRRTIYRTWIRSGRNRLLDVFDCPDPSTKTPRRAVTVTPLQALALMNNSFVLRMSQRWAERLRARAGDDVSDLVVQAYQHAYQRNPDAQELREAAAFVETHGLEELCRVIFNSNEFLYVD